MNYYKIIPDTKAYKLCHDLFHFKDQWTTHKKEIDDFLGFPMERNLYLNENTLTISRDALKRYRLDWWDQFKKNSNPAVAKQNSSINKLWQALSKKLKLKVIDPLDVSCALDFDNYGFQGTFHEVGNSYYYSTEGVFKRLPLGIKKSSESDFLKDKLAELEKKQHHQQS